MFITVVLLALITTGPVGCGLQAESDQGSSFICLLFVQHSPSLRVGFVSRLATLRIACWLSSQVTRSLLTSRKKERLASCGALFRTRNFLTRASPALYIFPWIILTLAVPYQPSKSQLLTRRLGLTIVVIQSLSRVQRFAASWTAARQAPLSSTVSQSWLKFMSIESVMLTHLILCRPFLLLPSVFPSSRVFSSESALCIWWPKYCSFSFSISSSNDYSELISFKTDWFGLFAVQGTLKSLLQHNSKASFVGAQPSLWSSSHVLSSSTWLRGKSQLWLHGPLLAKQASFNFMATVTVRRDFGAQENKICHCFHFSAFYLPWNDGTGCHHLSFLNYSWPNSVGTESDCSEGDPGSVPGLGRSPGEGNGNQLQYSCLENPLGRGACRLQSMGRKSRMWPSN